MNKLREKPELSVVILNYNTKKLLLDCIDSLNRVTKELNFEIIIVDNGSTDESVEVVSKIKVTGADLRLIKSDKNLGFAGGNNLAKKYCRGKYVLFLNSDTQVRKNTLRETVKYLENNKQVGALGCKIILPSGKLDRDSRRAFPTPWASFTHFSRLDRLFFKSRIFSKYWYGYLSEDETHEVDVLQGAYFLSRKKLLDKVDWFDEDYFLDGEDIDLSWKIKETGAKIIYFPKVSILHIKKASKKGNLSFRDKLKFRMAGMDSMEIFYRKRLSKSYPLFINLLVIVGIKIMKLLRIIQAITT